MAHNVITPHLRIPLCIHRGEALVVEQDSEEEIVQTAATVLYYERGDRTAMPEYGLREQALREGGADLQEIEQTVLAWDDRAVVFAHRHNELAALAAEALDSVVVDIGKERLQ